MFNLFTCRSLAFSHTDTIIYYMYLSANCAYCRVEELVEICEQALGSYRDEVETEGGGGAGDASAGASPLTKLLVDKQRLNRLRENGDNEAFYGSMFQRQSS